jgi:cyclopropane fatty-acyl-phospholipid synthase-like methyltransferase
MLSFIGNQFKKPKGFFGKIISVLMKKGNRYTYEKIVPELEIKQGDTILEIGYGHGLGINMICSTFDCRVIGIDFSELMFKEAQQRNKRHIDNKKVELHYGDFLDFKLRYLYDKIFCINVIYFWNELDKPFSKINAGLKDEGAFYIYMVHSDNLKKLKFTKDDIFNKYSIDYVLDTLRNNGFSKIDYSYNTGYFIKCKK